MTSTVAAPDLSVVTVLSPGDTTKLHPESQGSPSSYLPLPFWSLYFLIVRGTLPGGGGGKVLPKSTIGLSRSLATSVFLAGSAPVPGSVLTQPGCGTSLIV